MPRAEMRLDCCDTQAPIWAIAWTAVEIFHHFQR